MPTIVSNSELQRSPSSIIQKLDTKGCIVTKNGIPQVIMLPYFEESDDFMEEYYERLEISQNRTSLQKECMASKKSGDSEFQL